MLHLTTSVIESEVPIPIAAVRFRPFRRLGGAELGFRNFLNIRILDFKLPKEL
jgi:hypothetical protein